MSACPRCGRENPVSARFCSDCGASLDPSQLAHQERKIVTVLFADLVGFTTRAEQLDPEDVQAVLGPYHARVKAELERFGGTVEKFIGDAVMALFGATGAHEDDPERAVRAALAIRDWIAEEGNLQVRIGINTGEALVTLGARPEAGEGMASGDVVNTAARLQVAAPIGGIIVGGQTYRVTRQVIDYRELEPLVAKGKAEPIPVWEAVEARSRFGVDVRQHGGAALVGRQRELDLLIGTLARVRQEREPELVTLVGVPGIGKSRLVFELFGVVEADPELITWRQGRSLPYGDGVTFWALGEIAKAHAGILETDAADEAEAKLTRAVEAVLSDPAEAEWVGRHLRPLVGLAPSGAGLGGQRDEAFGAWRRFLEGLAEQGPVVLVFEDLHWADDDLLDFVDHLVEWAGGVPMMVVGTARPELLDRRPGWGGGKANATTLTIRPLSEPETQTLVHALVDRAVLRADVQDELLARAGGNPLYAEEFVRMMTQRELMGGPAGAALPESIQGIIAARIDALGAEEKALLQDAAVVGKVFWVGALGQIANAEPSSLVEHLHGLERKEFIRRERRPSVAGETEYTFRHVLVRDVAYGQIPRAARAEKHRLMAEWIESLTADRTEDAAEMLAHHYGSALEFARAAGQESTELAARAMLALRDAGDRAVALNAGRAADAFYARALELTSPDDPRRPELLFARAQALDMAGDETRLDVLEQARDALLASGQPEPAAEAEALLARYWWYRGVRDRAFAHQEAAETLLREGPDSAAAVGVLSESVRLRTMAGEFDAAIRMARDALTMADAFGLVSARSHLLNTMGVARLSVGDAGGMDDLEESLAIAREAGDLFASTRAVNNLANMLYEAGDLERSFESFREALQLSKRLGGEQLRYQQILMAWVAYDEGRWDESLETADSFIAQCERSPHALEVEARWLRASIWHARGAADEATADLRRSLELAREVKDPQSLLAALSSAIRIHAELGRLDEADALAAEFSASPGSLDGPTYSYVDFSWAASQIGRAGALRDLIDRHPHQTRWIAATRAALGEQFEEAAGIFGEMGTRPHEAMARLRAGDQLLARGRRAEAEAHLEQALGFFRSVGATRYLNQAETLLATTARR